MTKRVLLIAFHFPPQATSSGIQRTLSFSRNLRNHDWEPIVLTAHPRAYGEKNLTQMNSIPKGMVVRRAFALDTKIHLGYKGRYPSILALPDRWIAWWFAAVPAGLRLIRRQRPCIIWSTFPISTSHLIGLALHRLTGIPWVADFRDPMLQKSYPTGKVQRIVFNWIERQTIKFCHKAVFTTQGALRSYQARFPEQNHKKFVLIENGYDEDNFSLAEKKDPQQIDVNSPLTLLHSGVLYDTGRDPSAFLQALKILKRSGLVDSKTLRVVLRAPGDVQAVSVLIAKHGVSDLAVALPSIPYHEALSEMLDADGLLVFQGTPFNSQLPAKVYEYFRAQKPLFGLVDRSGETAKVLSAAGFNNLAVLDDPIDIAKELEIFLNAVRIGTAHIATRELVENSSRAHRALQLAELFEEVISDQPQDKA